MKVSELIGAKLDYWVAVAEGFKITRAHVPWRLMLDHPQAQFYVIDIGKPEDERSSGDYMPSKDWGIGGPIIEREQLSIVRPGVYGNFINGRFVSEWNAYVEAHDNHDGLDGKHVSSGPAPLIAAMRVYVASKFGNEVPDQAG